MFRMNSQAHRSDPNCLHRWDGTLDTGCCGRRRPFISRRTATATPKNEPDLDETSRLDFVCGGNFIICAAVAQGAFFFFKSGNAIAI